MKLITDILREYRRGRAVDQMSEALAELVRAVTETRKSGVLSIKITVKPDLDGGNQKSLNIALDMKKPMPSVPEAVFFSDDSGDLHRSDPDQREMFSDATAIAAEAGPKVAL